MKREEFSKEVLKEVGKNGVEYWNIYKTGRMDWCCCFVTYTMQKIAKIASFPTEFSCSRLKEKLSSQVNKDYKTAEIGDIILIENNGNTDDGPDHVGVVIDNNKDKQVISLIEGNTASKDNRLSSVNVYKYPYYSPKFDCIIDMSNYFSDNDEDENNSAQSENKKLVESAIEALEKIIDMFKGVL